jgi:hypothetical protein
MIGHVLRSMIGHVLRSMIGLATNEAVKEGTEVYKVG